MSVSFPVRIVDVFILQVDFMELSTVAKKIKLGYYAGSRNRTTVLNALSISHFDIDWSSKMGNDLFFPDTYFHSIIVLNRKEVMEEITKERRWRHSG
jgi:hypothetical protein